MRLVMLFVIVAFGVGIGPADAFSNINALVDSFRAPSQLMEFARQKRQDLTVLTDGTSAACVTNCLRPMMGTGAIGGQQQNGTPQPVACPNYEPEKMEAVCEPFRQARTCLDQCPDGSVKQFTLGGFKPLEFMCIERKEDFKKHMPCLTSACAEVQNKCEPICGNLDQSVRHLTEVQAQARSRGVGLDSPDVLGAMGESCQLIDCVSNCSRDPWTKRCGPEAYELQRDTILSMMAYVGETMASVGLEDSWPRQCRVLLGDPSTPVGKSNDTEDKLMKPTTMMNETSHESNQSGASNRTDSNSGGSSAARKYFSPMVAVLMPVILLVTMCL